jgi:hypothetical protein
MDILLYDIAMDDGHIQAIDFAGSIHLGYMHS